MRNRILLIALLAALLLLGLMLLLRQPWQHRQRVLSAKMPGSTYAVELWERPDWNFGLGTEYQTWLVLRPPSGAARWHLIDGQYITFRNVTLLVSSDRSRLRVETDGATTPSHLIAEYNFRRDTFRAESEPSVRNTKGWEVLSTARIHGE